MLLHGSTKPCASRSTSKAPCTALGPQRSCFLLLPPRALMSSLLQMLPRPERGKESCDRIQCDGLKKRPSKGLQRQLQDQSEPRAPQSSRLQRKAGNVPRFFRRVTRRQAMLALTERRSGFPAHNWPTEKFYRPRACPLAFLGMEKDHWTWTR